MSNFQISFKNTENKNTVPKVRKRNLEKHTQLRHFHFHLLRLGQSSQICVLPLCFYRQNTLEMLLLVALLKIIKSCFLQIKILFTEVPFLMWTSEWQNKRLVDIGTLDNRKFWSKKNFQGFNRIQTHGFCLCAAVHHHLSYEEFCVVAWPLLSITP